jgi:hypothetical protein
MPTPPPTLPMKLELTNCTQFLSSAVFPRQATPGSAPPGWEPKDPKSPLSFVDMVGYECPRVNVGAFERGPVRIVWDGHNNVDVPANCTADEPKNVVEAVVNSFLVSDPDVAAYLHTEYGLPAIVADIQHHEQTAGSLTMRTWTWDAGQGKSELTIQSDEGSQPQDGGIRLFWQHGSGMAYLTFVETRLARAVTDRVGYGTMQPPMLLSGVAQGSFAGAATFNFSTTSDGTFRFYSDLQCKTPAPPA